MILSIIVATDENNGIGLNNQLLWHLPADLKLFKQTTSNHSIIMGRKTYESIGKALPKRRNIVISRQKDLQLQGIETFTSLDDAIKACHTEDEVFIIGGAEIYNLAIQKTQRIYQTQVHHTFMADVFFPTLNPNEWEIKNSTNYPKDEANAYDFTFNILEKIN